MAVSRKKPKTTVRAFGVDLMMASHPEVRRLKRENPDFSTHGNKVWRSSMLLMDYLKKDSPRQRSKGMEIGCGWGPASIFMAKQFRCKMTAVDLDPAVFPFLQAQAAINGVTVDTLKSRFEKISGPQLSQYDYLIGSDICFWDEMVDPLFKLIKRAKNAGVKAVYIADPGRTSFLELAERCEKAFGVEYEYHEIKRPVRATGFILKV
ncbi:MAG: class I SAM-dependent methyltransferase [Gammaproteobacteria bacterium]|nr:MAG: class I SAM-dependent methyltransferase [Gammaproteobacteria bacterium]